tara:strand:+ start:10151 stop:10345 length:195 start_codon:yes stop_codon:yes gene_type:complete
MQIKLTPEYICRLDVTIKETEAHQTRELSYMPEFRNKGLLSFYEAHLKKLNGLKGKGIGATIEI